MLVDSHCHLDFPAFADALDMTVARAGEAGVETMVTICTKVREFDRIVAIAERFPNVWCTVGLHPHEAAKEPMLSARTLVGLAAHPRVVGIGETGLDYYYDNSPRETQRGQFRAHIAAARETGLPLVVHTRDADADTGTILAEEMAEGTFAGVLHCFSSGRELAEKAVELGFYVSFSGILTFKNAESVRETAAALPLERLLVETDAPFLAPIPYRGKTNEPAYVAHTAARLAELRGLTSEELARVTSENFYRLFRRATPPASSAAA